MAPSTGKHLQVCLSIASQPRQSRVVLVTLGSDSDKAKRHVPKDTVAIWEISVECQLY